MFNLSLPLRLQLSLIVVIGAAFLKPGSWAFLGVYGLIALLWAGILRVKLPALSGLLGTELIFLCFLAIPLGWERAGFLLVRSLICLVMMNSFLLTLPPHSLGIALKGLPIPGGLKENLLLAGQYMEILTSEVTRMQRGAQLRGLGGTTGWLRYSSAAMIGALYLRSLQRAERVYAAMLTRGYNGELPMEATLRPKERLVLFATIALAASLTIASYSNLRF